jgi:hypothetical protein
MSISEQQVATADKWLRRINSQMDRQNSKAADWWDKLTPEWRGVVLHAAAVHSGGQSFKVHLSKCSWRELFSRLDYRAMMQLRRGISRARLVFGEFGSLRDADFSPRKASHRPEKQAHPIQSNGGVQMVIAPHIVNAMQQGDPQ